MSLGYQVLDMVAQLGNDPSLVEQQQLALAHMNMQQQQLAHQQAVLDQQLAATADPQHQAALIQQKQQLAADQQKLATAQQQLTAAQPQQPITTTLDTLDTTLGSSSAMLIAGSSAAREPSVISYAVQADDDLLQILTGVVFPVGILSRMALLLPIYSPKLDGNPDSAMQLKRLVCGVSLVCLVFLAANLLDMLCRTKVKPLKLRELEQMREDDVEGGAAKLAPAYSERAVPTAGTYEPPLPRRIVTQLKMGTHGGSKLGAVHWKGDISRS